MNRNLQVTNPDYSTFDLSHIHRTSFDMGQLIPLTWQPILPRDKLEVIVSNFIRAMPTKVPLIDGIDLKINHFYIPYRCLWNGFEQFISQARNGRIETKELPTLTLANGNELTTPNYKNGRLADYLGLSDMTITGPLEVNAMPFLAYHKIYLDHYAPKRWVNYANPDGTPTSLNTLRDRLEQVRDGSGGSLGDEINSATIFGQIRKVNWNHDYFTNALPSPTLFDDQKLPLFTSGVYDPTIQDPNLLKYFDVKDGTIPFDRDQVPEGSDNEAKLGTIRDLRQTITVQHYLEYLQQADGGYMETMKIHWNKDLPNDLLQRSEYIGGDVTTIFNNEVESTSDTESSGGQGLGALAGKPIGGGTGDTHTVYGDEFGIYMCIAHVVPKRSYANAIHRTWLETTPLEFPNPLFENIGDQDVKRYELTGVIDHQSIWGFVPRYSHYKTALDRFSGEMRYSLKDWHMGTFKDELLPFEKVSPQFMDCNPRVDVFQVPGEPDKLLGTFQVKIKALRPLQNNSKPGVGYI